MTTNRWIENSRKAYTTLLNLYPKEHRSDYGTSMQQVFTDQCRNAYQQNGALGIILLWLRILPDLGYTALVEHTTSTRAIWGLMEPVPNAPLPWKGVLLVLLPGLVYLVGQIAQLTTGQPWFMNIYNKAAFLLIIPVLAVWAITRRFPLWGLIPVGIFYRVLQDRVYEYVYRIISSPGIFSSNLLLKSVVMKVAALILEERLIPVTLLSLVIMLLAWRYMWQQKPSRSFWIWIGIYLLAAAPQITSTITRAIQSAQKTAPLLFQTQREIIRDAIAQDLFRFSALLLLIFIGTLFTRRHGFFAILIPIGYMIPTIIFGFEDATNPSTTLIVISIAVLVYRSTLTLIAPIWMSRTSSQNGKKRVMLISIAFALGIYITLQFYQNYFDRFYLYYHYLGIYSVSIAQLIEDFIINVIPPTLTMISAFMLGVVMYQNDFLPANDVTANPLTGYEKLSIEKV